MDLGGRAKAAVFLLSLPEERAVKILQHLDETELLELRKAVEDLGPISGELIEGVYMDFAQAFKRGLTSISGSSSYLQGLVRKAQGEEQAIKVFATDTPGKPGLAVPQKLPSLQSADPYMLSISLSNEHPQVAAAVLAHLDATLAGQVVAQMSMLQQGEVLRRIAKLTSVPEAAFADAEQALAGLELSTSPEGEIDGVGTAAAILNSMPGTAAEEVLELLAEEHPDEAGEVRRAMFTFENLLEADQRGLQQLLREVQSDTLLAALKTASEQLKAKLFGCMSSRAAAMLAEELELMPPMRVAEVEEAQFQVVEIAMRLVSEGKLSVGGRGEDLV